MSTLGTFVEFPCVVDPDDFVRVMFEDEDEGTEGESVRLEVLCTDGCTVRLSDEDARALAHEILKRVPCPDSD